METITVSVWAVENQKAERGFDLTVVPVNKAWFMNESDINIGNISISFDAPGNMSEIDLRLKAIETLEAKKETIMAEAYKRTIELQKKIDAMKLLTYVEEGE